MYAVYIQRQMTLQISSKWCNYKLMILNYLQNKKHCCINDIMKNKKFLMIHAFFYCNAFGKSLALSFLGDFVILVLQSYWQSEHNTKKFVCKAFNPMASIAVIPEVGARSCLLFSRSEKFCKVTRKPLRLTPFLTRLRLFSLQK